MNGEPFAYQRGDARSVVDRFVAPFFESACERAGYALLLKALVKCLEPA